jgi:hypothetical protein
MDAQKETTNFLSKRTAENFGHNIQNCYVVTYEKAALENSPLLQKKQLYRTMKFWKRIDIKSYTYMNNFYHVN